MNVKLPGLLALLTAGLLTFNYAAAQDEGGQDRPPDAQPAAQPESAFRQWSQRPAGLPPPVPGLDALKAKKSAMRGPPSAHRRYPPPPGDLQQR